MTFSIPAIIRAFVAPRHKIFCSRKLWNQSLGELYRRGKGQGESGAFLLGHINGDKRQITRFVFYDDVETNCLDSGIVIFTGAGYGLLWKICRESGLQVVADVHTHPGLALQSGSDRDNPMIATPGHLALIIPNLAERPPEISELGIYEYLGAHHWIDHSGRKAANVFYIGYWG